MYKHLNAAIIAAIYWLLPKPCGEKKFLTIVAKKKEIKFGIYSLAIDNVIFTRNNIHIYVIVYLIHINYLISRNFFLDFIIHS